ncbi:hypothetical protein BsWGS_15144 [Bradybaena similaris]
MSYQGTGPPTEGSLSYGADYGDYNAAQQTYPYGATYGQYYNVPQPGYLYAGSQPSYGATMQPQGVPYTYTLAAAEHWGLPPIAEAYDPRQPQHFGADPHGQASVDSPYSSSLSRAGDRKSQAADDADPKREKSSSKGSDKHHSGSSRDDRVSSHDERTTSRGDLAGPHNSHFHDGQAGSRERHFRGDQASSRDGHPHGDEKKSDADLEADLLSRLDIDALLQDERLRNVLFAGISKATTKLEQTLKSTDKKLKNDASVEESSRLKPQQSAQTSSADALQKPKSILKRTTAEERVEVERKTSTDSSKSKTSTDPFSNLSALERTLQALRGKTSMAEVVRASEQGSRGSEKPPSKPTGALRQLESYNDSGDEEHAEKDTKTQAKTKNAQSTQPFWSVDAIPAVEEKGKGNKLPDIQEQMYEQWRQSINQSSNVQQASKEQDVSKVNQVFQKPEQAHNLASSSQSKRAGDKDDEELDSTVQNILQSIGFNFDLSKRMQELARQKKKQGGFDSEIDQSASFLEQSEGLVEDVRAALFSDRQEKAQLDCLIQEAKVNMEKRSTGFERSLSPDAYSTETQRSKKKVGGKWVSPEPDDDRSRMVVESRGSRSEQTPKMLQNQDWEDLSSDEDSMGGVDPRKLIEKTVRQPNERHVEMRQQSFSRDGEETSSSHSKVLLEGARKYKHIPRDSHNKSVWLSERIRDEQEDEYFYPDESEASRTAALSSKRKKKSSSGSKSWKPPHQSGSRSTHMENLRVTSRAVHDDIEDGEHFSQSRRVIVSSKSGVRIAPQSPVLRRSHSPEVPRKRPASPLRSPVPKERRVFNEKQSSSDLHDFLIRSLEQNAPEICQALGLDLDAYYKSTLAQTVFSKLNAVGRAKSPIMNEYLRRDSVRKSPDKQILRSSSRQMSRSPDRRESMSPVRHTSRSQDRQSSRSSDKHRSWSPDRNSSKSVEGRKSRSPARPKARSLVKATSPARRRSRSPTRRGSRSPIRRRSKSPARRRSVSPVRRRSRSPVRWRSKSPDRRRSRSPRESSSRARSPGRRTKLPERQRSPVRAKHRAPKKLASVKKLGKQNTNRDTNTGKSEPPAKGVLSNMSEDERKAHLQKLLGDKFEQIQPEQVKALPKEVVKDLSRKPETQPQKGAEEQQGEDASKMALKKDIKLAVEKLRNFPVDERKIILIQMTQMSALERCNLLDDISAKQVKVGLLKAKMLKLTKDQNEMMRQSGVVNANLPQLTKNKKAIASVDEEIQRLLKASFYIPQLEKTDVPEKAVFKKPQAMKAPAKLQKQQSKVSAESERTQGKLAGQEQLTPGLGGSKGPPNSDAAQTTSGRPGDGVSPAANSAGDQVGGSSATLAGRPADKNKDGRRDGQMPTAAQGLPSRERVYYEYYDSGNHWCKHCSCNFSSLEQLLQHNHTKAHLSIEMHKKPWKTSEVKQMKPKVGLSRSRQIKGAEMMSPVIGFYCNLCQEFFGDLEDSTEHLKDDRHYDQYMEFVKRNPQYEKSLLLEKTGVHMTSKTPVQWTYPAPPPREVKRLQPPLPPEMKTPQPPLPPEVKTPQPPLPLTQHGKADSDQQPKVKVSRKNLRVKDAESGDKDIIEIVDMDLDKEEEAAKEDVVKVPKMPKPSTVLPPWIPQIPDLSRPEVEMKQTKEDDNQPLGEFLSIEQKSSQLKQVHLPVLVIPEFDYLDEIPLPEPEESSPLMEIPLPEESDIPLPEESDISLLEEGLDTSEEAVLMNTAKSLQQVMEVEKKSIEDENRLTAVDDAAKVEKLIVTTPPETETLVSAAAKVKGAQDIKQLKQQKSIDDEKRMMGIDVDSDIEKPLSAVLVKPPPIAQTAAEVKNAKDLQLDETIQAVGDGKQKVEIDRAKMSAPTAASQGELIVSTPVAASQGELIVSTPVAASQGELIVSTPVAASQNEPKVETVGTKLISPDTQQIDTGKVGQQEVASVDSTRTATSGPGVAELNIAIGGVKDVVEKFSTKSSDMDKEKGFEKPTLTVSDQNSKTVTSKCDVEVDLKVTSLSYSLAAVTGQTEVSEKGDITLPEMSSPLLEIPLQDESDIPLPEESDIPFPEELDIPLPEEEDIPLPEESDIPLPEEEDIPLPEESVIPLREESDIPLPGESDIPLPGESSPALEVSTVTGVTYQADTQMDVTGETVDGDKDKMITAQTIDSEKDKMVTGQAVNSEMVKSVAGQTVDREVVKSVTGQTVDGEMVKSVTGQTVEMEVVKSVTGQTVDIEMVKCVTGQTVNIEMVSSVTGQADTQVDVTYQAKDSQKCKSISASAVESQKKAVPSLAEKRKKDAVDTIIISDSSEDENDSLIGDKPTPAKRAKLATLAAASQDKEKIAQAKKVSTSPAAKVSSPAVVKVFTQATEQVSTSKSPKVSTPTAAKASTPTPAAEEAILTATKASTPTATKASTPADAEATCTPATASTSTTATKASTPVAAEATLTATKASTLAGAEASTPAAAEATLTAAKASTPAAAEATLTAAKASTSTAAKVSTLTAAKTSTPTPAAVETTLTAAEASTPAAASEATLTAAKTSTPTPAAVEATLTATKASTPTAANVSTLTAAKTSTPTPAAVEATLTAAKASTPTTATKAFTALTADATLTATKASTPAVVETTLTAAKASTPTTAAKASTPAAADASFKATKASTPAVVETTLTAAEASTPAASEATLTAAKASTPTTATKASTLAAVEATLTTAKASTPAASEATLTAAKASTPTTATKASTPAAMEATLTTAEASTPAVAEVTITATKASTPTAAKVSTLTAAKTSTPTPAAVETTLTAAEASTPAAASEATLTAAKASTPTTATKASTPAAVEATLTTAKASTPAAVEAALTATKTSTPSAAKVSTPTATKASTLTATKVSAPAASKASTPTAAKATATKVSTPSTAKVSTPSASNISTPAAPKASTPAAGSQVTAKVSTLAAAKVLTKADSKVSTLAAASHETTFISGTTDEDTPKVSIPPVNTQEEAKVSTVKAKVSAPATSAQDKVSTLADGTQGKAAATQIAKKVSTPATATQAKAKVSTPATATQAKAKVSTPVADAQDKTEVTTSAVTKVMTPTATKDITAMTEDTDQTTTTDATTATEDTTPTAAIIATTTAGTQAKAKVSTPAAGTQAKVSTLAASTQSKAKTATPSVAKVTTPSTAKATTATKVCTSTTPKVTTPTAKEVTTPAAANVLSPTAASQDKLSTSVAAKVATPATRKVITSTAANISTPAAISQNTSVVSAPVAVSQNTAEVFAPVAISQNTAEVSTPVAISQNTAEVSAPAAISQNTVTVSAPVAVSQNTAEVSAPAAISQNTSVVSAPAAEGTPAATSQVKPKVSTLTAAKDSTSTVTNVFTAEAAKHFTPTATSKKKTAPTTANQREKEVSASAVGTEDKAKVSTPTTCQNTAVVSTATTTQEDGVHIVLVFDSKEGKDITDTEVSGGKKTAGSAEGKQQETKINSTVGNLGEVQCDTAGSHEDISGHTEASTASPTVSSIQKPVSADPVAGSQKVTAVISSVAGSKKVTERKELDTPADSFRKEDMSTSAVSDSQEQKLNDIDVGTANKEDTSSVDVNEPSHGGNGVKQNRQDIPDENIQTKKKVKNTVSKTSQKQTALEDTGAGDFELASASIGEGSGQIVVEEVSSNSHDKPEITVGATRGRGRGRKPKNGPDRKSASMSRVGVDVELLEVSPETAATSSNPGSQKLSSSSSSSDVDLASASPVDLTSASPVDLTSASPVLGRTTRKMRGAASKQAESPGRVTRSRTKKEDVAEKGDSELVEEPLYQHRPAVLKPEESSDSDATITDETGDCLAQRQPAASRDSVSGRRRSKKSEKDASMGCSSAGTG